MSDSDDYDDEFDFSERGLTSLPELPDDLRELMCNGNRPNSSTRKYGLNKILYNR